MGDTNTPKSPYHNGMSIQYNSIIYMYIDIYMYIHTYSIENRWNILECLITIGKHQI